MVGLLLPPILSVRVELLFFDVVAINVFNHIFGQKYPFFLANPVPMLCNQILIFAMDSLGKLFLGGMLLLMLWACATSKPYSTTNKLHRKQVKTYMKQLGQYPVSDSVGLGYADQWVGTTNFSVRKPNFVIIHHTAQDSCPQTLRTFTLERTKVSAHYVICRDGTVHHMLHDGFRAQHAGVGRWGNLTDMNSISIGIELDNNGSEPFAAPQMEALYTLLGRLKRAYNIPTANFIGHADWAPTRKNDPSVFFDWKGMADRGFGLWYGDTTGVTLPPNFNSVQALRLIGYDVRDSTAAIRTFKQKYLRQPKSNTFAPNDLKILYLVMKSYLF